MLQIVAGKYCVNTLCFNRSHIDHGPGYVRLNSWVDVKTDFSPFGQIEPMVV